MNENNFLVIDNILIPDIEQKNFKVYEKDLDVMIRMINGRLVIEERGSIWVVEATFEDIDPELLKELYAAMKATKIHTIAFLPPNGGTEMTASRFCLTQQPQPALKSWYGELPEWSDMSYVFEEEEPHD